MRPYKFSTKVSSKGTIKIPFSKKLIGKDVEVIRLLRLDPFDYTTWQDTLWENKSVKQVSEEAMKYRKKGEKDQ